MKEIEQIEKSLIKRFRKEIYSKFIHAVKDFDLVKENDHIAVCISGGKDSFLLAKCMQELKRHNKFNFEVEYIVMDPGYKKENLDKIKENAKILNIPIKIFKSNIFEVLNDNQGKSRCYLCARMRRGFLYSKAKELGCNKIALGHHFNDVIETILLNQIYNGTFSGMLPILNSDNFENMQLIRPLFYVKEKDIISFAKYNELSFLNCACEVTARDNCNTSGKKTSKRQEVKELTNKLVEMYNNADINIFNSMFNVNSNTTKTITKKNK